MSEGDAMKVVVLDMGDKWECHKADCQDAVKKLQVKSPFVKGWVQNDWEEDSLEIAEANFNEDMIDCFGEEDAWVWARDVKVHPCAKEG
jgi:hypothetical protein